MKENINYVKRTQRDYSMSLKHQIVKEIEQRQLSIREAQLKYGIQAYSTVVQWLRKFGNFEWENQIPLSMTKELEKKILDLEVQIKVLEKNKIRLERLAYVAEKKAILLDMMIDLAEKEYHIDIRKNTPLE